MSRIFFAELRRLVHYRLYHAACAAVVLFSLFYAEPPVVDRFLFNIMIVIGAFSAVCVSQFIGVEYSCGTIRNKLVTGHTRTEIYLAQLVLHILAAVILFHISILTIVIAGALFNWTYDSSVQILIVYYIACMCTIVLITAVSVFVSMQSSSTMASFVILLLLYAGLSMLGTNCHGALLEQEIQMTDTSQAGNPPEEMDAGIRMCFEHLLLINPYGQAAYESMPLSERHGEYVQMRILDDPLPRIFLFSAVESFGLTVAGILAFQKKELK